MAPSKLFLHAPDNTKLYVSYGAALRSYYLKIAITKAETTQPSSSILDISVPVDGRALVAVMEHCERHLSARSLGGPAELSTAEQTDRDLVADLEAGALLRLAGAAHMLNVEPLLSLALSQAAPLVGGDSWDSASFCAASETTPQEHAAAYSSEFLFTGAGVESSSLDLKASTNSEGWGSPWGWGGETTNREADCWITSQLGSERAVQACLEHFDAGSLQRLKSRSMLWRARARRALCSEAWRERQRASDSFDAGRTRQWSDAERCEVARFVLSLPRLTSIRADGLQADLDSLANSELLDGSLLVRSLTSHTLACPPADALALQNEFLALAALWLIQNSKVPTTPLLMNSFQTLSYPIL